MRFNRLSVYLAAAAGTGFGIALALGPAAAADTTSPSPIDTWIYTDSPDGVNTLPGYPVSTTPPGSIVENPFTFDHAGDPPVPWYQADVNLAGDSTQTTVTKILDPAFGYPSVGTVADQTVVNIPLSITSQPPDFFNLYSDYRISDPGLGTGEFTTYFNSGFANYYVSDSAGTEDQMTFAGGAPVTLFDIPASGSGTGAAADLGDGFQQLLADLTGATGLL